MFTSSQLRQSAIATVYKATKAANDETAKKRLVKIASCLAAGKTIKEAVAAAGITGDVATALTAKLASGAFSGLSQTTKKARGPVRRMIGNIRDRRAARQGGGMQMQSPAPTPAAPTPPAAPQSAPRPVPQAQQPAVAKATPAAAPTTPQNNIQADLDAFLADNAPMSAPVETSQPRPRPTVNRIDGGQFSDAHPLAGVGANAAAANAAVANSRPPVTLPNHDASIVPTIISQPLSRAYENTVNAGSNAVQSAGVAGGQAVQGAGAAVPAAANLAGRAASQSGAGMRSAILPQGTNFQDFVPPALSKLWQ